MAKFQLPKFNKKLAAIMAGVLLLLASAGYVAFQYFWDQPQEEEEEQPATDNGEPEEQPEEGALVTKATASVSPKSYTSTSCSKKFSFTGKITTSREGTVKYYWEKSNGTKSSSKTVKFTKADTKTASYSWTVNGDYEGWARVKVTSPEALSSGKASFTETCTFAVTSVTASVSPSTNNSCPTETYNFTGRITANEAGTVKYKWEKAFDENGDGDPESLPSSSGTVAFTGAGTKTVTRSDPFGFGIGYSPHWLVWLRNLFAPIAHAIGVPGYPREGWERLKITSPNSMTSNKAEFVYDQDYCD